MKPCTRSEYYNKLSERSEIEKQRACLDCKYLGKYDVAPYVPIKRYLCKIDVNYRKCEGKCNHYKKSFIKSLFK